MPSHQKSNLPTNANANALRKGDNTSILCLQLVLLPPSGHKKINQL